MMKENLFVEIREYNCVCVCVFELTHSLTHPQSSTTAALLSRYKNELFFLSHQTSNVEKQQLKFRPFGKMMDLM
jgi:hypothetical protein